MANCVKCGRRFTFTNPDMGGSICDRCSYVPEAELEKKFVEEAVLRTERAIEIEKSILLTTETVTNLNISKRIKIIMCATTRTLDVEIDKIQDELFTTLRERAVAVGANAVVGVTISFVETYSASAGVGSFKNFRIIACGTAVVISDTKLP